MQLEPSVQYFPISDAIKMPRPTWRNINCRYGLVLYFKIYGSHAQPTDRFTISAAPFDKGTALKARGSSSVQSVLVHPEMWLVSTWTEMHVNVESRVHATRHPHSSALNASCVLARSCDSCLTRVPMECSSPSLWVNDPVGSVITRSRGLHVHVR